MTLTNLGAVRRLLLVSAVLTLCAVPSGAQVVEKGRTLADLIASHPCASGLENRIARVTDCDAADDFGDGGGAFNCWAYCDGSAPWTNLAIGGGSGGSGDVVGPASATDNAIVRFDSTTGKLVQTSNLTCSDVSGVTTTLATITPAATTGATVAGQSLAITASPAVASTDTAGADDGGSVTITTGAAARNASGNADGGDFIVSTGAGIGTGVAGQLLAPDGSTASPGISFEAHQTSGLYWGGLLNSMSLAVAGNEVMFFGSGGVYLNKPLSGEQQLVGTGVRHNIRTSTAGVGAPADVSLYSFDIWTNEGSTALNYQALGSAVTGRNYTFCVQDGDGLRIVATAGDTIRQGASVSSSGGYIESTTIGSCIELVAVNVNEWFVVSTNDLGTNSWSFN